MSTVQVQSRIDVTELQSVRARNFLHDVVETSQPWGVRPRNSEASRTVATQ